MTVVAEPEQLELSAAAIHESVKLSDNAGSLGRI
jgi:hypothetical protein